MSPRIPCARTSFVSLLWRWEPEVRVLEPRERVILPLDIEVGFAADELLSCARVALAPRWCVEADDDEGCDADDEGCDDEEDVDEGCDDEDEDDEGCDDVLAPWLDDLKPSRGSIPANSEAD